MVKPGCLHHPLIPIFHVAVHSVDQISDTINQLHLCSHIILQLKAYGLSWNKLRFRGHDRFPLSRLRQFIHSPLFCRRILHLRQHHHIHEPFDKRRLAGTHRSNHTKVDISTGSGSNILINIRICHSSHPLLFCLCICGMELIYTGKERKKYHCKVS